MLLVSGHLPDPPDREGAVSLLKRALFVLIIFCFSGLLLEGGLRLFSAIWYPKMMILDEQLGWRHARNVSKVFTNEDGTKALVVQNGNGHRGTEYGARRSKEKIRIMFLGDSFTEGSQVNEEELFTTILERANPNWEVINAGVGGYGTVQEYLYLMNEGLHFNSDLVVLMVYENDFSDNCLSYSPSMGPRPYADWRNGQLHLIEDLDWAKFRRFGLPIPFQRFLHANSYLYYFINTRIFQVMRGEPLRELEKYDLRNTDACAKSGILAEIVRRMHLLLRGTGSDLVLVAIPTFRDVTSGASKSASWVLEICTQENLRCLSLVEYLVQAAAAGERPYFDVDIHWTRKGHEIAARAIEEFLVSAGIASLGTKRITSSVREIEKN